MRILGPVFWLVPVFHVHLCFPVFLISWLICTNTVKTARLLPSPDYMMHAHSSHNPKVKAPYIKYNSVANLKKLGSKPQKLWAEGFHTERHLCSSRWVFVHSGLRRDRGQVWCVCTSGRDESAERKGERGRLWMRRWGCLIQSQCETVDICAFFPSLCDWACFALD